MSSQELHFVAQQSNSNRVSNSLLASERSERDTIRGNKWKSEIYVYVIARVGVKFGINFTSVRLSGNKIARGEAECYLPLNLTRVKFIPVLVLCLQRKPLVNK